MCFTLALTLALSLGERELRLHGFDLADDCSDNPLVDFANDAGNVKALSFGERVWVREVVLESAQDAAVLVLVY